ncbi:MAG: DUF2007 domain-containing protein [Chloroflexi bacterium]|nr:DUF2007 domain-containing protein [Chloroflexota bacterium]
MAEGPLQHPFAAPRSEGEDGQQWVTLRTAPNQLTAELWRELLLSEGIPATLAPADAVSFLGLSSTPCRVLVPAASRAQAELVLDGEDRMLQDEER